MTVSPKLRIALVALLLLAGVGFVIFAVFINRGTLQVTADLPYDINIVGLKGQSCTANPCSITLAPGNYNIQISKSGYKTQSDQISIQLGQTLEKSYQLKLNPQFTPVGPWNPDGLFSNQLDLLAKLASLSLSINSTQWTLISNQLGNLANFTYLEVNSSGSWIIAQTAQQALAIPLSGQSPKPLNLTLGINYYFAPNSNVIYFIADNPTNSLPSLFRKDLGNDQSPEILINFVRTIVNPRLIINAPQTRVAMIEQTNDQEASLYLLDLQAKTRQLINEGELISNVLWLPDQKSGQGLISDFSSTADATPSKTNSAQNQKFIIEKINSTSLQPNLYLADTATPENQALLPLNARLASLFAQDSSHLLLAEAFPNALSSTNPGFNILSYDLSALKSESIYGVENLPLPQKLQYESATHTLYLLIGGTVYSLAPIL